MRSQQVVDRGVPTLTNRAWIYPVVLILCLAAVVPLSRQPDYRIIAFRLDVERVEVEVSDADPPQVRVRVAGTIGDGCDDFKEARHHRSGSTYTLELLGERHEPIQPNWIERLIFRESPRGCGDVAKTFERVIPLQGTFPPGAYTLRVNDVEVPFRVPRP